jgi:hypothetical protein
MSPHERAAKMPCPCNMQSEGDGGPCRLIDRQETDRVEREHLECVCGVTFCRVWIKD